ncbi:multicopper oxidase domain-containing protein [Dissulfurirhabdus thermomarina]|uniref:Multicopper oxidase domain-containing protein n=1 Tax=Dissulfurirhabdus thermomarina TaxID=1765737 RepID=A0A6N9TVB3_DISTH|nr:multicopper oxidase domain-containing protein [Dissulfurirhabdus thermomarina]NDY42436.1 multicopper oxidase domain-containing protein [Dissulfurirhabdus thermomarina]NMX24083.1 multicopper oxidase domain-containing protein [Dissulfurirhabdus thermomarina]
MSPRGGASAFALLLALLGWIPAPWNGSARAALVTYELTIARGPVNVTGRPATGMTVNGTIPGPVLAFREGDRARIRVHNAMDVPTSIHWHGVLVPPGMDGVPYVSFPPIAPGATFTYEFPIRQSGTYWYHSHSELQEQSGVYGGIVIRPARPSRPERDHVIVLSDWTDEDPASVFRTLKRGSEWYAFRKGAAQSLLGAAKAGRLGDFFRRELLRMPPMDIADVAYDRFLANGRPESTLRAAPGEEIRLRIINGSATTYFLVEFAGGPLTVVAADGQEVEPVPVQRLLIAVAETYDVRVRVPGGGAYELRATAHDGSGRASVWLGAGPRHPAPAVPRPDLYAVMGGLDLARVFALTPAGAMGMPDRDVAAGRFDRPGMAGMGRMGAMEMDRHGGHGAMKMPEEPGMHRGGASEGPVGAVPPLVERHDTDFGWLGADVAASAALAVDGMDPRRPGPPYPRLRAVRRTAPPPGHPVRVVRLTLDGDMERYVWTLNGRTLSEEDTIRIRRGEIVRFVMVNRTMMHHPMHLHGHFFRVLNGQGDRAPLKHTVDVAPMSTTVIEFLADETGDWFFHCHLLYHMKSGMARVVHYEGFPPGPAVAGLRGALRRDAWLAWARASVMSHMTEGAVTVSNTRNIVTAEWEVGWQDVGPVEWEGILTWDRYFDRFFTAFAGADMLGDGRVTDHTRGVLGLRYLLPLGIESRAWVDSDGGARVSLDRHLPLTPRLELFGGAEYDTRDFWEGRAGLLYRVSRSWFLRGEWHSDYGFGAGLEARF